MEFCAWRGTAVGRKNSYDVGLQTDCQWALSEMAMFRQSKGPNVAIRPHPDLWGFLRRAWRANQSMSEIAIFQRLSVSGTICCVVSTSLSTSASQGPANSLTEQFHIHPSL